MDFQGLPISVENRKGSCRYWYDPNSDTTGVTKMIYPYGYIRGTLGIDGDEVDVYIGNDKKSDKVYVVTQYKKPEFTEIDEQKVMLGFRTQNAAKLAYLAHYNDKRFFKDIKEFTLEDFKSRLISQKGVLLKGALLGTPNSVKISNTIAPVKKDTHMTTASEALDTLEKALSARVASSISRRARMASRVDAYNAQMAADVPTHVGSAQPQPEVGTSRERLAGEPPVVPIRTIHNTMAPTHGEPVMFKSCDGCGRMNKSTADHCLTCSTRPNSEATPIWRR